MRRYLPLCLLVTLLPLFTGCGESPNRPSVVTVTPSNPPKTNARFIQAPWDISLFFNLPGGAVVAGPATAATPGAAAEGDNLTGTFVNSTGFAGTLTGVLTGTLENGNFNGTLSTITLSGCTAERRFSGPITTAALNWSPGAQINDCGGTSPLTSGIQAAAAPATAPPPCTYQASATGTSVPAAGGTGTVTVGAGEGCTWFATSSQTFVTLSASQGTAAGSVQFTVAPNTSTTERTAVLVVAGSSFTITQAALPACVYRLNGRERTFDANGALGGVDMRTASHCAWRAESDAPWLTITSGSGGTGDGTISYNVAANPGLTQRVGRITATRDELLTVTQLGIVCQFTLTPAPPSVPFTGGAASIAVVPNVAACPWTATVSPAAPWITITAGGAGTGNGAVTLSFAANPTAQPRVGTVTVGTATATFTQAPTTLGSMTGLITNSLNNLPIAEATVTITPVTQGPSLTTTTNAAGIYTFASVQQGSYNVLIRRPAFGDARSPAPVSILAAQTTTFNAALTPNLVNLTLSWNPNPTSVDPVNPRCPEAPNSPFCWRSTLTMVETGGTAATTTSLTIHFFDAAGVPGPSVPGTTQPRTIPGFGTVQIAAFVFQDTPTGGRVVFEYSGTDAFGRSFSVSSPQLVLNTFVVPGVPALGNLAGQPSVTGLIRQGGGDQPAAPSSGTIRRQR
jgi:hypothetical protein